MILYPRQHNGTITTMKQGILAVFLALATASCVTDSSQTPRSQQLWTPQGEPVSCIITNQIRSTHVVDDRTIHFSMTGRNRMYRNELPFPCPGLAFSRSFKHNSRTGRLCNVDTITVIQAGRRGATCGLGRFQPMVPVESATPVPQ